MDQTTFSVMQPSHFIQLIECIIADEQPAWSRKALSKLLAIVLPRISAKRWEKCLTDPSKLSKLMEALMEDEGWILGRFHRTLCEARAHQLWETPPLKALSWIETYDLATGALQGGRGLHGAIANRLDGALHSPIAAQVAFWKSFADAFALPISIGMHDTKTFLAYLFIGTEWGELRQCKTIREIYQRFRNRFPAESAPIGTDPIDFDERQFKWFEKLCQRNLGISLARRGRPAQT